MLEQPDRGSPAHAGIDPSLDEGAWFPRPVSPMSNIVKVPPHTRG